MKGFYVILFLCVLQEFFCYNFRAEMILRDLFPSFKSAVSKMIIREDIIVKNKYFYIDDLFFDTIEFDFYNSRYIDFRISGVKTYFNFDVYPNPGNRDIHENNEVQNKDFNFRGHFEFVRDTSYTSGYRPHWIDYNIYFDLEPVYFDDNMKMREYVIEDYYQMRGEVQKNLCNEWEYLIIELLSRLYSEGIIN